MRTYFSTLHWKKIMNGYSGFLPTSLYDASAVSVDFPSERSIGFFRKEGVRYVIVHGQEMDIAKVVKARLWSVSHTDLVLVGTFGSDDVYYLK